MAPECKFFKRGPAEIRRTRRRSQANRRQRARASGLRLDRRLAYNGEIDGIGDKAEMMRPLVQIGCQLRIVATPDSHPGLQGDLRKETAAIRIFLHGSLRFIGISQNSNARIGTQMQVPKLVTSAN